jgi:hypothetical protein
MPNCEMCGDPMPPGEEMFKYHGYSGPCPKPIKPLSIKHGEVSAALQNARSERDELLEQRDELLTALKDASRTLKSCMSACDEKRKMGIQSQPCLVCRVNAAIAKAEEQ